MCEPLTNLHTFKATTPIDGHSSMHTSLEKELLLAKQEVFVQWQTAGGATRLHCCLAPNEV
jgi:hypothetical protein